MSSANLRSRLKYALGQQTAADELLSVIGASPWGKTYYVNADTDPVSGLLKGSDENEGTSDQPLLTLAEAYDRVVSNAHDIIVLSGSTAHVLTAALTFSKNRFHIVSADPAWGLRWMGQRTRITSALAAGTHIAPITITGVGVTLHGLKITSADTAASSVFGLADGGEFTILDGCWIEKNTDLDQAGAAELLCNGDTPTYIKCCFGNMIYQPSVARQNVLFTRNTIAGKVARDLTFERCLFQSFATATTFVNLRATANDIERLAYFSRPVFASKKGSTLQDEAIGIAVALTDAQITLDLPVVQNITNIATAASGVFSNLPNSASLGGVTTQVT